MTPSPPLHRPAVIPTGSATSTGWPTAHRPVPVRRRLRRRYGTTRRAKVRLGLGRRLQHPNRLRAMTSVRQDGTVVLERGSAPSPSPSAYGLAVLDVVNGAAALGSVVLVISLSALVNTQVSSAANYGSHLQSWPRHSPTRRTRPTEAAASGTLSTAADHGQQRRPGRAEPSASCRCARPSGHQGACRAVTLSTSSRA